MGFSFPLQKEAEVKNLLEALWQEFPDATHICWAYVPESSAQSRSSDDGEPMGTAGKPILNQIHSAGLKNVLVAVVRYYGGTKLGTSGLISAYKQAAEEALHDGGVQTVEKKSEIGIAFPFSLEGRVNAIIKKYKMEVGEKHFSDSVAIKVFIPLRSLKEALTELESLHGLEVRK